MPPSSKAIESRSELSAGPAAAPGSPSLRPPGCEEAPWGGLAEGERKASQRSMETQCEVGVEHGAVGVGVWQGAVSASKGLSERGTFEHRLDCIGEGAKWINGERKFQQEG